MSNTQKRPRRIVPPRKMIGFSWGGTTQEWEEEADQVMHIFQDQLDIQESDEELRNKIDYAHKKRYWNDFDHEEYYWNDYIHREHYRDDD